MIFKYIYNNNNNDDFLFDEFIRSVDNNKYIKFRVKYNKNVRSIGPYTYQKTINYYYSNIINISISELIIQRKKSL